MFILYLELHQTSTICTYETECILFLIDFFIILNLFYLHVRQVANYIYTR